MPPGSESAADEARLQELVDQLLVRDADAHEAALAELAAVGDRRVAPHLVETLMIHEIASDWSSFGFPEVLRDRAPPRYLELPEARWPGVLSALRAVAQPEFDSRYAWVEWETWYTQQEVTPLGGFDAWKLRLFRTFLPPVGRLLDVEPRAFDLADARWGNCDGSFLAACNEPPFVPGDAVAADGSGGNEERYLDGDDVVFGLTVDGTAYAVPRAPLFPHELLNATLQGVPVSLAYCTLCNAPICYDRRVDGRTLTFGNTGLLLDGNKLMFDDETESLWRHHRGDAIAGRHLERGTTLDARPVTQTTWAEWREHHPDTLALSLDTGYGYDYGFYEDDIGFFRHYWNDPDAIQPGLEHGEGALPEKEPVYGVVADDGSTVRVYPVDAVPDDGVLTDEVDGREVVVLEVSGDVMVYETPPTPVERRGDELVDADGRRWTVRPGSLVVDGDERERIPGRHGLFFAFRTGYDNVEVY